MHAGALHVLHDAGDVDVLAVAHGVGFQLLAGDVVVHEHRLVLADQHGGLEVVAKRLLVGHDLHGPTAQHIAGAHQHRVADALGHAHAGLDVGHGLAVGLRNAQRFHHLFKGVAVFRATDGFHVGADDLHAHVMQALGQIDGRLPAQAHHHALGVFEGDDVHHVLHGEGLKIELVAGGVVGGHGFGVVVDDDGLVARAADGPDGVHGGVVKLHALADADGAGAQHNDLFAVRHHGLVFLFVGGVEVGHVAFKLAGAGVDHLVDGHEAVGLAQEENLLFRHVPHLADVPVAEAQLLGRKKRRLVAGMRFEHGLELHDVFDLLQKQHVDLGPVVDEAQVHAAADELGDGEQPVVRAVLNVVQQLIHGLVVKAGHIDVAHADFQRPNGLEQAFLDGAAHAHHFARGLHLRAQAVAGALQLVKGEARHFADHVVQRRLKAGRRVGQGDLLQMHAHRHLGRHARDGVAAGLGRKRRGAGDAGVDLDQVILEAVGVQSELHVAPALDLERPDDFQRAVAQHMVFLVGQRLAGAEHDGIARVHTHGVDVFHVADGDGGVVGVAHHLVLDLLVALDALFHQHLMHRGELERVFEQLLHLLGVVGKAAARAAQRKGGAQHHRVADLLRRTEALLHAGSDQRRQYRLAQALAQLLELLAVLRHLDGFKAGAQNLHLALVQHALAL